MSSCKLNKKECIINAPHCTWIVNKGCRKFNNLKSRSPQRKSRSPVRIPLKKGELRKYGYSSKSPKSERQRSLERATEEYGPLSVFRKLNALATMNKNRNPELAAKFIQDRNWVKRTYGLGI